jgi:FMN phosphatase YigB (HAD superfamily)
MIVVKIGDGLGNQLYNYACGYAAAKKTGQKLKLDTSECDNSTLRNFELDNFKLESCERESFPNKNFFQKLYKRARRDIIYHLIKENPKTYSIFDERVFRKKRIRDTYLHGYWQNIEYFKMYERELREQFKPNYEMNETVHEFVQLLKTTDSCAIHMRGQDIRMPDMEYFEEAIRIVQQRKPKVELYIFTNDRELANERLMGIKMNQPSKFVQDLGDFSDIDEFFMISACQNQIISDSTFSRWAALLNENTDKIVVAPTHDKNEESYPTDWIKI